MSVWYSYYAYLVPGHDFGQLNIFVGLAQMMTKPLIYYFCFSNNLVIL
jgi:hypothetical protein